MNFIDIPLNFGKFRKHAPELELIKQVEACRTTAHQLAGEKRYRDAVERIVEAMHTAREFPDFSNPEFRALVAALLFDLAELHFELKDFKQGEKDLDNLFKVLEPLVKKDPDRFGPHNVAAMEVSTRILRSRRKLMDLLTKQQMTTGMLFEKVNAGVAEATDKLVESLRKTGELLASMGSYREALKFYTEAIKYSKKRSGRVTPREISMTIEMAEVMRRVKRMRSRAKRLLEAVLPHAIAAKEIKMEEDILALIAIIDADIEEEPRWKALMHKLSLSSRKKTAEDGD